MTVLISQEQFYIFGKLQWMTRDRQCQQPEVRTDKGPCRYHWLQLCWTGLDSYAVCAQLERALFALLPFW